MAHRHVDVRRSTKIVRSQAERYYHEAHGGHEGKNTSVSLLFPFVLVVHFVVKLFQQKNTSVNPDCLYSRTVNSARRLSSRLVPAAIQKYNDVDEVF